MATKIFIVYGFAEGKKDGEAFERECERQGFRVVDQLKNADLIVTHSGGCFFIDEATPEQKLVLINPPYWPGKKWSKRMKEKILQDMRMGTQGDTKRTARKLFWNSVYMVTRASHEHRMFKKVDAFSLKEVMQEHETLIIRSDDDPWCSPHIDSLVGNMGQVRVKHIPGAHDSCWLQPKPYVSAIADIVE